MKLFFAAVAIALLAVQPVLKAQTSFVSAASKPDSATIQVAILLDVSGSMEGLIEQAKIQLWSMVETLGKASCNGVKPAVEIALYEYGRPGNGEKNGFIKQISPFSTDLDELSASLFKLKTDGGDEYCGAAMVESLKNLAWRTDPGLYKVIFIAGNESFRQGSVSHLEACKLAKEKGVIINTIYCGAYQLGITEYWNLNGECGSGTYTNINQNEKYEDIKAPQDSLIYALNTKLNGSYITFNSIGIAKQQQQAGMDEANLTLGYSVAAKRAGAKANKAVYRNTTWDLVDAIDADSSVLAKLDKKFLPAALQNKTPEEIARYVSAKRQERGLIQKEIGRLLVEREKYVTAVRAEKAKNTATAQNLENAIQNTIKSQAKNFRISFDD